ncbi:MAG: hypothetical protein J0H22_05030, partial [Actinobacteria bacterium]|nr:hypothetical protein [Actinomycetota bacterium]
MLGISGKTWARAVASVLLAVALIGGGVIIFTQRCGFGCAGDRGSAAQSTARPPTVPVTLVLAPPS